MGGTPPPNLSGISPLPPSNPTPSPNDELSEIIFLAYDRSILTFVVENEIFAIAF